MNQGNHRGSKDRRDIGKVISLIEKMDAAREISSSCVGVEALLETNHEIENQVKQPAGHKKT